MKFLALIIFLSPVFAFSQGHDFKFGTASFPELNMKTYAPDTSAVAVVLNEFGEAYISSSSPNNLVYEFHSKIKILKPGGLKLADFTILLWKYSSQQMDLVSDIQASSFALDKNSGIVESKLDSKSIFTERSDDYSLKRFAIPNVRVGSVIEVRYRFETARIFNFKEWEFQDDIPKIRSEYWATIPANYVYNIALKGYLKLSKNDSEVLRDCFTPTGNKADCTRLKFAMENIPAFRTEEFLTAPKNYIAAITFELSEIKHFTGVVDKVTKDWKDVEDELRHNPSFGVQLKRGKDIMDNAVDQVTMLEKDPLKKAKAIYDFVKFNYQWNGKYNKYCDNGIKKAFDSKKGNVGDINLSLVAALRYADLDADPVILSTRANGFVTKLYPVMSDFNYVVAKVTVGGKAYLLDATDRYLPFGTIPIRCINGEGRVIGDRKTEWVDLTPSDKLKRTDYIAITIDKNGVTKGTMQTIHMGYRAVEQRKKIYDFDSVDEYKKDAANKESDLTILEHTVDNLDSLNMPLIEKYTIEFDDQDHDATVLLINPFINNRWKENPLKSTERFYPVDFAAPREERVTFQLNFPEDMEIVSAPTPVGLALPNNGGRYVLAVKQSPGSIVLSSWLAIDRTLYTATEYHYLRELFAQLVQTQSTDIMLRKKE